MLIIAVCDDNQDDKNKIVSILEAYLQNKEIKYKIFAYDNAEQLLAAMAEKGPGFDIIFLDIVMDDMNGMTCARLIRQQDNIAKIVFLTSCTEYVYEGYEVNAARYLLKPISENTLITFLEETIVQIQEAGKESITITSGGVTKKILIRNILYLESEKNIVKIVVVQPGESIAMYTTLDGFEKLHPSQMWIRSHKSFLVNFLYIEEYKNDQFVLQDGTIIPISRTYKNTSRESFYTLLNDL